ncbi:MAG: hypothetical protein ACREE7_08430, partial [Dongiaceae bacterium]
ARAAKSKALTLLQHAAAVVGVGIARQDGGYCVKVNVSRAPSAAEAVPASIDGVPVRVEVVGVLRKRPANGAAPRLSKRAGRG